MITLETHDFQAPGLYEQLGYTRVGTTVDTPHAGAQYRYWKRLDVPPPAASRNGAPG